MKKRTHHQLIVIALSSTIFLAPSCYAEPETLSDEMFSDPQLWGENEAIFTSTRYIKHRDSAPAVATVITRTQIKRWGARTLADVFNMLPSAGISISEWGVQMFEMRGIRSDFSEKILIMLDNHPLNKNFNGTATRYNYNDMPLDNVRRIEVIRGPGSALFGESAFIATINIITRDALDEVGNEQYELTAATDEYDTRKLNLFGGHQWDNGLKLSANFDLYDTDGYRAYIESDRTSNTPWASPPGYTNMEEHRIEGFIKASLDDWTYRGHYTEKNKPQYIGLAFARTDEDDFEISNQFHELNYRYSYSDDLFIDTKLFYDLFSIGGQIELLPEGFAGIYTEGMIGGPYAKYQSHGIDLQMDLLAGANHQLVLGTLFEEIRQYDVRRIANYTLANGYLGSVQDTSAWENWNQNVSRTKSSLYIQDDWQMTRSTNLISGLRHDHYSDFGNTTNPRLGLVSALTADTDIKVLYGRAFRAPNFGEQYTTANVSFIGNRDATPEIINTLETSLILRNRLIDRAEFTLYKNKIKDLITINTSVAAPAPLINSGKAETQGIEAIFGHGIGKIDGEFVTSYTEAEDGISGNRLPYIPYWRAKYALNYAVSGNINLNLNGHWVDQRPRSIGDNRADTASYNVSNLSLLLNNLFPSLDMRLTVFNLFDKEYVDPDTSGALQFIDNDLPRDERNLYLEFTYHM